MGGLQLVRGLGGLGSELGVLLVEPLGVETMHRARRGWPGPCRQQHGADVHAKQAGNPQRARSRRHGMVELPGPPAAPPQEGEQGALAAFRQRLGHRIEG